LKELAKHYQDRGIDRELAMKVALQLTEHNALEAHTRDELGINENIRARPLQAALASFSTFIVGGLLPFSVTLLAPIHQMIFYLYSFSIVFLALSGAIAAKVGGSKIAKAIIRICLWGTIAMAVTALVGYLFGVNTG
jgi:VIT1/CCC1 family predicted Fe2+/Mn2+ transporter